MSSDETPVNIVGLITSFQREIKTLPDDLKCSKCQSVLKDSYQLSCGCRFCRNCIDNMVSSGDQFCSGDLQECRRTPLSTAVPDYRANKNILKLTAKCPHVDCPHECPLLAMESHMRVCSRKNIHCPFRALECAQGALPGEEMSGYLLQESRSHSEILIETVTNISRDMGMLKQELVLKDDQERHLENEMKLIRDENKSMKDEMKSIKIENKLIKDEIKSIKDENKLIKDENRSIKIENELIKQDKEVFCDRVRKLSEKLEREIEERRQSDERDCTMVTAVTAAVASNRDEMEPVINDIRSLKDQFECMKCRVESIQVAVGLGQLDDWLIDEDISKTEWDWFKDKFKGEGRAHTYEVVSRNSVSRGELGIYLLIWAGPSDNLLQYPFKCEVTVTVAHRNRREACSKQTRQCWIERPGDNRYSTSDVFEFSHVVLKKVGLDLRQGVLVSCQIVPGPG